MDNQESDDRDTEACLLKFNRHFLIFQKMSSTPIFHSYLIHVDTKTEFSLLVSLKSIFDLYI